MKCTNYEAPHYAILSIFSLLLPRYVQTSDKYGDVKGREGKGREVNCGEDVKGA
jgi:hypothetical protein